MGSARNTVNDRLAVFAVIARPGAGPDRRRGEWVAVAWTDERIALLREWAPQFTATEIAYRFGYEAGISRNAVIGKCARMGISLRKPYVNQHRPVRYGTPELRNARRREQRAAARLLLPPREYKRQPLPPPPVNAPAPRNLTVLDLGAHTCKWPVTEAPPHAFCGHGAVDGEPYCGWHMRRAHSRTNPEAAA